MIAVLADDTDGAPGPRGTGRVGLGTSDGTEKVGGARDGAAGLGGGILIEAGAGGG